jgi:tetratricopeptide (TPR) repeat protein
VLLRQGRYDLARRVLAPLAEPNRYVPSPGMAIVTAAAYRQSGEHVTAARTLQRALSRSPGSVSLLNDLVLTLQETDELRPKALMLLPRLLRHELSANLHDTAALVYLRSGMTEEAKDQINKALALLKEDDPSWPAIMSHAVEVAEARGDEDAAGKLLEQLRNSGRTEGLTPQQIDRIGQ